MTSTTHIARGVSHDGQMIHYLPNRPGWEGEPYEHCPQRHLADLRRPVARNRLRRGGNHLLHPHHHHPVRHRVVPDRGLRAVAVRPDRRRQAVRRRVVDDRQRHLADLRRHLAGDRPHPHRDPAVHLDHRNPTGDREPQDDPDLTDAAGQGHRPRKPRVTPGTPWLLAVSTGPRDPRTGRGLVVPATRPRVQHAGLHPRVYPVSAPSRLRRVASNPLVASGEIPGHTPA
jgi:hypothetical protein